MNKKNTYNNYSQKNQGGGGNNRNYNNYNNNRNYNNQDNRNFQNNTGPGFYENTMKPEDYHTNVPRTIPTQSNQQTQDLDNNNFNQNQNQNRNFQNDNNFQNNNRNYNNNRQGNYNNDNYNRGGNNNNNYNRGGQNNYNTDNYNNNRQGGNYNNDNYNNNRQGGNYNNYNNQNRRNQGFQDNYNKPHQQNYNNYQQRNQNRDHRSQDPEAVQKRATRRENNQKKRAEAALPIFERQGEIMDHILNNKFTIVVGDTGCGKSTQLPQYLYEHYEEEPNAKILWVLPRKLPTVTIAQRVADEMGLKIGQEVGYRVPNDQNYDPNCLLKFTMDSLVVGELIEKRAQVGVNGKIKLDYTVVVLDEVHERNLYTDILLAALKEIASQTDLKVVITSATIDEGVFERYFNTKPIKVSGRIHPVDIEYSPIPAELPHIFHIKNTIMDLFTKAVKDDFLYKGHILVFTAGVDEIQFLYQMLTDTEQGLDHKDCEVLQLHGLISVREQQEVLKENTKKTKIILATRMAETSITINGVRVVIDIGFDKEMRYDSAKRMTVTEVKMIPQSSAIQRAGRAGRTAPGMCIRLYAPEDFESLTRNKISEVQRMNLGNILLKLKALGVTRIKDFEFVERPDPDTLVQTLDHLVELGALDAHNEMLTDIGWAMLELDTDPSFSKVIIEALSKGCEQEVINTIAMVGVTEGLYVRGFTNESKENADKRKMELCHPKGDLITLLNIYTRWQSIPQKNRQRFCDDHCLNNQKIYEAEEVIKRLWRALNRAKTKLRVRMDQWIAGNKEDAVIKCFLAAFYQNVCIYTNISRVGYCLLREGMTLVLHGSSTLQLMQEHPQYIMCLLVSRANYSSGKIATAVNPEWFAELFPGYKQNPRFNYLAKVPVYSYRQVDKIGKHILNYFASKKMLEIKQAQESLGIYFYPDFTESKLFAYTTTATLDQVQEAINTTVNKISDMLEAENSEQPMTLKTRVIYGSGGQVRQILLNQETLSLKFENFDPKWNESNLLDFFKQFGRVDTLSAEVENNTQMTHGLVKMSNLNEVSMIMLQWQFNEQMRGYFKNPLSELQPILKPISSVLRSGYRRILKLRIEWFVGNPGKTANLIFRNAEALKQAFENVKNSDVFLNGKKIILDDPELWFNKEEFKDKEGLDLPPVLMPPKTENGSSTVVNNIGQAIDEIDIEKALNSQGLLGAKIFRSPPKDPNEPKDVVKEEVKEPEIIELPLSEVEALMKKTLYETLQIDQEDIIRIKMLPPRKATQFVERDYRRIVEVDVYDLDIAKKIISHFDDNNTDYKNLTVGRTHCTMSFSTKIGIKADKIKLIQEELYAVYARLRERFGQSVKVIQTEPYAGGETCVRFVANDPLKLDECRKSIEPIVKGASFPLTTFSQRERYEKKGTMDQLSRIQVENNVYIYPNKKKTQLKVIGSADARERTFKELNMIFNNFFNMNDVEVKVSFKDRAVRGLLENDAKVLSEMAYKHFVGVTYSLLKKEIVLWGRQEDVQNAAKEITDAVNAGQIVETVHDRCPICGGEIKETEGYLLQLCQHKYCRGCLEYHLLEVLNNNPQFPLYCGQCGIEGYASQICIKDLCSLLTGNKQKMLWQKSLDFYLNQSGGVYFRCFSQNCPQIFRKDGEKEFSCDYCMASYCKECKQKAHGKTECNLEQQMMDQIMNPLLADIGI